MKVMAVLIALAAVLTTGFLWFDNRAMQNDLDALRERIDAEQLSVEAYRLRADEARTKAQSARETASSLQAKIDGIYADLYYKENFGVFLTFENCPNDATPAILDILKTNGVKATFFIVGTQIEGREDVLRRMVDEGHTVALQCYNNHYETVFASEASYFDDLYLVRDAVEKACGVKADVVRFTGGSKNAKSYFDKNVAGNANGKNLLYDVVLRLRAEGFELDDWTVDATSKSMVSDIKSNISKREKTTYKTVVPRLKSNDTVVSNLEKIIKLFTESKNNFVFDTLKAGHYYITQIDFDAKLASYGKGD